MVLGASDGYNKPLKGDALKRILRDQILVTVDDKNAAPPRTVEVNVVESYLSPFMDHYLGTREVDNILFEVEKSYVEVHKKINEHFEKISDSRNFARDKDTHEMMIPIIAPLLDFICGPKTSVHSCGLPAPVLAMMLEVDKCVSNWYDQCGDNNQDEKQTARLYAMISFLSTRSFMAKWTISLNTDTKKPTGYYQPLLSFINYYVNLQINQFAESLLNCDEDLRKKIEKKAEIYTSRTAINKVSKEQSQRFLKEKLQENEKEKSQRKVGLLERIVGTSKDKSDEQVASPRGKRETEVMHSPRKQLKRGETLKDNVNREQTLKTARAKVVDTFTKKHGLASCPEFYQYFKETVLGMEREAYKLFKESQLTYCAELLEAYIKRVANRDNITQDEISALLELSQRLSIAIGNSTPEKSTLS